MQKANRISLVLICLPHHRSRTPVCLTRHRFPSTRAYANGFHLAFSCRMQLPTCGWTLPLLCRYRSLHWNLPHPTPTFCSEYHTVISTLSVQLFTPAHSVTVSTLVNSGSSGNFISQDLLSCLQLPHRRHAQELRVETIQRKQLGRGHMKYKAPPLKLKIGNLHEEEITFLVLEGPTVDIILGCPWLILHSPEIR